MCDFKPGDEVVCVIGAPAHGLTQDAIYTVESVGPAERSDGSVGPVTVFLVETGWECWKGKGGYGPHRFRKAQKRNDRLTIEAFSVIKDGGFEEPRREPVKTPERVS
jgi:hypothetical protein